MIEKIIKNKKGVTLLELTVAVGIFSVMILSAIQIFNLALEGQRNSLAAQNIQESMRYALEVMSKEIRMAQKAGAGDCPSGVSDGMVYKTTGQKDLLYFKNYKDECVEYKLDNGRLEIKRGGTSDFITPNEIMVSNLKFNILDATSSQQARVTIKMDVEMAGGKDMHKQRMTIQTTVSARYYE